MKKRNCNQAKGIEVIEKIKDNPEKQDRTESDLQRSRDIRTFASILVDIYFSKLDKKDPSKKFF